jgi:pilus assembly protein Flp/PilA
MLHCREPGEPTKKGLRMKRLLTGIGRFGRHEDGPTAVEYAVMLALIVLICLASIRRMGNRTRNTFRNTARSLAS